MDIKEDNFQFYHYYRLCEALLDDMNKKGDNKGIIEITNLVVKTYFNQFCLKDQSEYVYRDFFIGLFFRKMQACYNLEMKEELGHLYSIISPYLDLEPEKFWVIQYSEVMNNIENINRNLLL